MSAISSAPANTIATSINASCMRCRVRHRSQITNSDTP